MKYLYKYLLLALGITIFNSCKKDDYTKLSHYVPTKLVYSETDATYTFNDLVQYPSPSSKAPETDAEQADYYSIVADSIYTTQFNVMTGMEEDVVLVYNKKDTTKTEYIVDGESGVITLKGNASKIPGHYVADMGILSSTGHSAFGKAWSFNLVPTVPSGDYYARYLSNKVELTQKDAKNIKSNDLNGIFCNIELENPVQVDTSLAKPFKISKVTKDGTEDSDLASKFKITGKGQISIGNNDAKKLDVADYWISIKATTTDGGEIILENVWELRIIDPYISFTPEVLEIRRSDGNVHYSKSKIHGKFNVIKPEDIAEGEDGPWEIVKITRDDEDLTGTDDVKSIFIDDKKGIVYVNLGEVKLGEDEEGKVYPLEAGIYKVEVRVAEKNKPDSFLTQVLTIHKQF